MNDPISHMAADWQTEFDALHHRIFRSICDRDGHQPNTPDENAADIQADLVLEHLISQRLDY